MDLSKVYNKTTKGARTVTSKSKALSNQQMRVLSQVNGKSTLESILADTSKLNEKQLDEIISYLYNEGYIKDTSEASLLTPSQFEIQNPIEVAEISTEEFLNAAIDKEGGDNAKRERERQEAEMRAKAYAEEQARLAAAAHEQKKSEEQMLNAINFLSQSSEHVDTETPAVNDEAAAKERERLEAEIKASEEAIRKTREEAAARQKQRIDNNSLDAVIARAEAERKAREAAEAQASREAEEKARLQAERNAREEAERKAHDEAERKAREAAEKARLEEEIRAREEAMRKKREEAEARAKREAEEKARIEAEHKAREEAKARAKAEAEAKARAEAERKAREAEEARIKLEAEEQARLEAKRIAREAAEARAKIEAEEKARAEAERRALKQAEVEKKAEAKLQAKHEAEEKARAKAEEKARRRAEQDPVDIYKSIKPVIASVITSFWTLVISVSVITLLLLVFAKYISLSMLVEPTQKLASESIQEPVTIRSIHASFWPQPHLVLEDVSIGKLSDVKASNVNVYPFLLSMFSPVKALKSVETEGLNLDQDNIARVIHWVASSNNAGKLKIDQIYLKQTVIRTHDIDLPTFNTDIKLDSDGNLKDATISNENHHLTIVITPENESYAINLIAEDWQAPFGPAVVFDELNMHGSVSHGQANFSQVDAKLYSGTLHAQLNINWGNLWSTTGSFQLAKVNLEKAIPVFSEQASLKGRLSATGTFSMKSSGLQNLISSSEVNTDFEALNGNVGRIDLVRTMQVGGSEQAGGGSTRFDALSGNLAMKDGHYQFRQLVLDAGQLKATGEIDIQENQSITGKIHTELNMKSRQLQSNSMLTGTLGSPSLN